MGGEVGTGGSVDNPKHGGDTPKHMTKQVHETAEESRESMKD